MSQLLDMTLSPAARQEAVDVIYAAVCAALESKRQEERINLLIEHDRRYEHLEFE